MGAGVDGWLKLDALPFAHGPAGGKWSLWFALHAQCLQSWPMGQAVSAGSSFVVITCSVLAHGLGWGLLCFVCACDRRMFRA